MVVKRPVLLDTSAFLTLRGNEPGADEVERLLAEGGAVLSSFMTRMELAYLIGREEGETAVVEMLRLVDAFDIEWVTCEPDILAAAARLKAQGGLSVADSWIGATAIVRNAVLIHKDPEFKKFGNIPQRFLE